MRGLGLRFDASLAPSRDATSGGTPTPTPFEPTALFAASEPGALYDASDLATMWVDAAGTTTPASVGQPVGLINDKSGRGNHATQATTASKPILRQSGARYYLEFDGVDDFLATGSINFTATDKMSVFAGVRKLSDAAAACVVELSASSVSNNSTLSLFAPNAAAANYSFASRGTTIRGAAAAGFASPHIAVLTGQGDISGDTATLRVNGSQAAQETGDQGAGNFGNYPLYIGRRGGSTLPFGGHLYGLILRGAATDATGITNTETWLNAKTGAY